MPPVIRRGVKIHKTYFLNIKFGGDNKNDIWNVHQIIKSMAQTLQEQYPSLKYFDIRMNEIKTPINK